MRTTLIAKWIEVSQSFIHGQPPKQRDWDATLFINNVELRQNSKGQRYLLRSTGCEFLKATSKQEMEDKVGRFMLREDVRLLAKGIEANDFDQLPQRVNEPTQEEIDGTANIYDFAEEPAEKATEAEGEGK